MEKFQMTNHNLQTNLKHQPANSKPARSEFVIWNLYFGTCLCFGICYLGFIPSILLAADKGSGSVEIRMRQVRDDRVVFEVTGLDQSELDQLAKLKADSPRWVEILAVFV